MDIVVTDSAGVRIVRSTSSEDAALELMADPVLVLGGKETPEESFVRVGSSTVGSDASGRIYVMDPQVYQVHVFEPNGAHVRTVGAQGEGPGELSFPVALAVSEDGRIWVADIGRRGLVHWDPDGQVMDLHPFPQGLLGGAIRHTRSGMVVPTRDLESKRLMVFEGDRPVATLAELPVGETRSIQLESCGMRLGGMEPIFSPALVWDASRGSVAVARNPSYAIDIYEDGRLVRSLRRDIAPQPASPKLAEASLGDGMRVGVGTAGDVRVCDPAEVVEQRGVADYLPMIRDLALAPDGTLWVRRYDVDEVSQPIDVFDPEGRYLGTLPPSSPFPVGFLPDGRILLSEEDELEVQRLVVALAQLGS
jgi:hypothetical protein